MDSDGVLGNVGRKLKPFAFSLSTFEGQINGLSARWIPIFVLGSLVAHGVLFTAVNQFAGQPSTRQNPQVTFVKVSEIPKPAATLPVQEKIKPPPPPKEVVRKPRVRTDERLPKPTEPQPEVEIRGGVNNSTALPGTGRIGAPSVAEGNSAEVQVKPEAAVNPPPPPVAVSQEDLSAEGVPVAEAVADTPADCPLPQGLDLTEDAVNAGVTSGELWVDFSVARDGSVGNAVLKKGTGYEIDSLALSAVRKLKCKPATIGGQPVPIKSRRMKLVVVPY